MRIFNHKKEKQFFTLPTDPIWSQYHLNEKKLPPAFYSNYDEVKPQIITPHHNLEKELGWSTDIIKDAKERFFIDNPITIAIKTSSFIDSFYFDFKAENNDESIASHINNLKIFLHFYREKAQTIIKKQNRNKPLIPTQNLENNKFSPQQSQDKTNPLRKKPKQFLIYNDEKMIFLTHKEYTCLSYLAKNYTSKLIAQELGISHCTVEGHIHNIKLKTNLTSQAMLAKLFWQNEMIL